MGEPFGEPDRGVLRAAIDLVDNLFQIQDAVLLTCPNGAVGSSYDNALAETINGLYKTELIKPRKPWRGQLDFLDGATTRAS